MNINTYRQLAKNHKRHEAYAQGVWSNVLFMARALNHGWATPAEWVQSIADQEFRWTWSPEEDQMFQSAANGLVSPLAAIETLEQKVNQQSGGKFVRTLGNYKSVTGDFQDAHEWLVYIDGPFRIICSPHHVDVKFSCEGMFDEEFLTIEFEDGGEPRVECDSTPEALVAKHGPRLMLDLGRFWPELEEAARRAL
jgi:hypothetical protein